jgi:hypothetical protein
LPIPKLPKQGCVDCVDIEADGFGIEADGDHRFGCKFFYVKIS